MSAFSPIPKVPATNFIDVSASFWARSAIKWASRGGVLSGFPGLKFDPNQNLTKSGRSCLWLTVWNLKAAILIL